MQTRDPLFKANKKYKEPQQERADFSRSDDWPKAPTQRSGRRGIRHLQPAQRPLRFVDVLDVVGSKKTARDRIAQISMRFGVGTVPSAKAYPTKTARHPRAQSLHKFRFSRTNDIQYTDTAKRTPRRLQGVESLAVRFAASGPSASRPFGKNKIHFCDQSRTLEATNTSILPHQHPAPNRLICSSTITPDRHVRHQRVPSQ